MKIGIIGCGNMGGAMAAHLLDINQSVLVFDSSVENATQMANIGAKTTLNAAELAAQCDLIILSLPKAAIVQQVMDEISQHIKAGGVVIDTSTSEPKTTRNLAKQAVALGYNFIDAPVSGGPAAASSGTMTMLIGGDLSAIEKAYPLLEKLASKIVKVGSSGAGHAAKIANNMLCAANLVLVAEIVKLGEAAGVPAAQLLEGINAGSGRSGVSEVNYPKWILNEGFDSGFTMGLMRKDVNLGVDLANSLDISLTAFQTIADIWKQSSKTIADQADFNEITKFGSE